MSRPCVASPASRFIPIPQFNSSLVSSVYSELRNLRVSFFYITPRSKPLLQKLINLRVLDSPESADSSMCSIGCDWHLPCARKATYLS